MHALRKKSFGKILVLVMVFTLLFGFFTTIRTSAAARGAWAPNTAYAAGDTVTYSGSTYSCLQAHTSLIGWEPSNVPALWQSGDSGSTPTPTPPPATNGVTFYEDINYGGTAITLGAGDYTLAQLNAKGIPNDWMTSLKVSNGWTVEVYEHDNFGGTKWTYTSSSSYVGDTVNDQMSSVKIYIGSAVTFTNPIVAPTAADPSVVFKDGYYYYCKTMSGGIGVAKTERLQDIGGAPLAKVYNAPSGTAYSNEIWAPELQYINGKWYIYFAADDGQNVNHRMYCLESNSQDPQGAYTFRGKVTSSDDKWAIDATVLQKTDGSLYFVWSGCENGAAAPQNLYIAPMSNPYTISGAKVMISTPTYDWEKNGSAINEGPEVLMKNDKIHIIYSASASWLNDYCLGRITCSDGNVLNPSSWVKNSTAVFSQAETAYGTGHNTFTKSPDGTEDWIVYHAFQNSGGGWGNRSVRAQRFTWSGDYPVFGTPTAYGAILAEPSGTVKVDYSRFEAINISLNFIRHINGRGHIDSNVTPFDDSKFKLVPGLADANGVSLESVNFPGCYLRHKNGEIWLNSNDNSQLFKDDATWYIRPGLAMSSAVSFESKNYPGRYMRHRDGLLYCESVTDSQGRNDATFWQR